MGGVVYVDEPTPRRSGRINLRVDSEADALLRRAARLEGKSLSAFLLDAGRERAQRAIDEQRRLVVDAETFERLLDELDQPPRVIPELAALVEQVREKNPA